MSTCSPTPVPVTPAVMETPEPALAHQQEQQEQLQVQADSLHTCRYPSKKCWNARALKRNGEMHNLCDEHRQKANKNQRRLEQKRKTSKKVAATKRVRKSRANKHKVAALVAANASAKRPAKQQLKRQQAQSQPQSQSTTASGLVAATETAFSHAPSSQTFPVRLNTTLPSGFFTELMLSENTLYAKQQQQLDLNLSLGLMGSTMVMPSHQHLLHQRLPSVNDFLDGDLDSLADCLDFSIPSFANLIGSGGGAFGSSSSSGSASPIDVCDGLDAVAAVNDFWWHPVVVVDPLLDTSALVMNEEVFSFHQH